MNGLLLVLLALSSSSVLLEDNAIMLNTGKIYVGKSTPDSECLLYIDGSYNAVDNSQIYQNGKIVLTGDLYNNVSSGNVITPGNFGCFEFRGNKVQYISGLAGKKDNYINFPDLIINNCTDVVNEGTDIAAVVLLPHIGITTRDLVLEKGRLILDSDITGSNSSQVAHLLVKGTVSYPSDNRQRPKHQRGLVQVKLALGDNYRKASLIGFTPPFKKIYSDYFLYNFLTRPTNKGLFGDDSSLIISPKVGLEGGKGYIVGLGIVADESYYEENWSSQWEGAKYSDRFTTSFSFGRDYAPESLSQFVNADDAFTGEMLNVKDVRIELKEGWNFLGNPFTAPLDMSSFLNETSSIDKWGVSRGNDTSFDVENKYYVLSQGKGEYHPEDIYDQFTFNVTYLVAQKVGSTITAEGVNSTLIAPMQLFAVKKISPATRIASINIPESARSHGYSGFIRSNSSSDIYNELLIETKENQSGTFDRTCIVFRDDAATEATDKYDTQKIFNTSGNINQIYTRSSDNKNLITNVVPTSTNKLTLHLKPALERQEIVLTAYRLNSLSGIDKVILEDKQTGATIDLLTNPNYKFTSSPTDKTERFVLRFNSTVDIPEKEQENLNAFYDSGNIHISHLEDTDLNSDVFLYDVSGKCILYEKVNKTPSVEIPVTLSQGTYILKLTGKRDHIKKVMVN